MRIGLFTPTYPGITGNGGIGTYVRNQSVGLVRLGHTVHVLTPGQRAFTTADEGVTVHVVTPRGFRMVDAAIPGFGQSWTISAIAGELVKAHHLEVFEFPNWEGQGIWFSRRQSVPMVVRFCTSARECQVIDGLDLSWTLRMDIWREHLEVKGADSLVTHSDAHRLMMACDHRLPQEVIKIIPLGIEVPADITHREMEPPTVVFLGRLERRKGTIDLLRAVPAVVDAIPDVRFVFIGLDRPHCPGGRTHAQFVQDEFSKGVQDRITLAGQLPAEQVDVWLRRAAVFVAPSLYESFGLVFLEAMRFGTPVIGTRTGGIPEIVEDGLSGLLVNPNEPEQIAAALVRLLSDRAERRRIGRAGYERVRRHFTIEVMAKRMESLYRSLLE